MRKIKGYPTPFAAFTAKALSQRRELLISMHFIYSWDFPDGRLMRLHSSSNGSNDKESACDAEDTGDVGLKPVPISSSLRV